MKKSVVVLLIISFLFSFLVTCNQVNALANTSNVVSKVNDSCTGSKTGHRYESATCETPPTCTKCGHTIGVALGHKANCTEPNRCTRCDQSVTNAIIEHNWLIPACEVPATCAHCGKTQGKAAGHQYSFLGQLESKCRVCGKEAEEKLSSSTTDAEEETPSFTGGTGYLSLDTIAGDVTQVSVCAGQIGVLRSDGTVRVIGDNTYGQCDTILWRNVVKIWVDKCVTFGLTKDGYVLATSGDCSGWADVAKLIVHSNHRVYSVDETELVSPVVVAIKEDGTVLGTKCFSKGDNPNQLSYLSSWTDIKDVIINGYGFIVGLKEDGTIEIAGDPEYFEYYEYKQMTKVKKLVHCCAETQEYSFIITENGRAHWILNNGSIMDIGFENIDNIVVACVEGYICCITKSGSVFGSDLRHLYSKYSDLVEVKLPGFNKVKEIVSCRAIVTGLCKDGTVVYTHYGYEEPETTVLGTDILKIVEWKDGIPVGLRKDGTIWHTSSDSWYVIDDDETAPWEGYDNIVDIWTASMGDLVALTEDGEILLFSETYSFSENDLNSLIDDVKH